MEKTKSDGQPYMPPVVKSVEHETPDWLFNQLDEEFHFTLDAMATRENTKCKRFFTEKTDGLKQSWVGERVWINPPHGAQMLKDVCRKAWEESRHPNSLACVLVPAKTDQSWWHDYALKTERRFVPGRVQFVGSIHGDMKPIIILVFEKGRRSKGVSLKRADKRKGRGEKKK